MKKLTDLAVHYVVDLNEAQKIVLLSNGYVYAELEKVYFDLRRICLHDGNFKEI